MEIKISGLLRQYAVVFIANLNIITTGMSVAWSSPNLVKLMDPQENPLSRMMTDDEASWMVSTGFLLTPVTNILGGILVDTIGRKYSFLFSCIVKFAMGVLIVCATEVWMLIFARTVMLTTDCFSYIIVPVYASEISSKEQHDALGSFLQIFSTFGAVLTLSVGPYTSYKTFNIILTCIIGVTTVPVLFLPKSPFYSYSKGRIEEAKAVLISLRGSEVVAVQEIEEYKLANIKTEKKDRIKLLTEKEFLKNLAVALMITIGSQVIGTNAILFYLQTIFISTNTNVEPELGSVLVGIIQVVAACCTSACVIRFGRRRVLFWTLGGYFLGMSALGVFFKVIDGGYEIVGFLNFLPLISLIVSVFCVSAGISTLLWPIIAEAFDGSSRAYGVSIALLSCNVLIFLITKYFPLATKTIGPAITYFVFAGMTVLFGILIAMFLPKEKKDDVYILILKRMRLHPSAKSLFKKMVFKIPAALFRQYAAVFVVNLSIFTTGMSMAWPSPVLVKLRSPEETPLSRPMTAEEGSWMVSLGFLGGVIADVVGAVLLDVYGRKKCLIFSSIPKVAMGILCIFATEAWMLILARAIFVTADCFIYLIVPIYSSEIADKNQRGALGSFLQVFSTLGSVVTLSAGPFLSYKTFNIIFTSLTVITALPVMWLPDSPFFSYKKGHIDQSTNALKQLRTSDEIVTREIDDYKISLLKLEETVDKIKLFKNTVFLKSFALGVLLSIGAQAVGFNAVLFYLQTILESTQTYIKPEVSSVVIGVLQFFAAFCTILVSKRFGRRTILLTFLVVYFIGMVGLGTFFKLRESNYAITGFLNYLPLISIILVVLSYSLGIGSLIWLITPELFDSHSRAIGVSISMTTTTFLIFVTTKYFQTMTISLGPSGTYWCFAFLCAVLTILLAVFLPETKDKSFNEIQSALGEKGKEIVN
ncbi:facilitated trehalose transporter Tret1-like [Aricia agestis]|uniref:facilitated trehalose transporter Tret1-like n=1 Tax=Aricia agestis TaxID=91739 RepID=UPI001C207964|nr:facilitated trehalose transporter Tret1-like [Aricia agestis]